MPNWQLQKAQMAWFFDPRHVEAIDQLLMRVSGLEIVMSNLTRSPAGHVSQATAVSENQYMLMRQANRLDFYVSGKNDDSDPLPSIIGGLQEVDRFVAQGSLISAELGTVSRLAVVLDHVVLTESMDEASQIALSVVNPGCCFTDMQETSFLFSKRLKLNDVQLNRLMRWQSGRLQRVRIDLGQDLQALQNPEEPLYFANLNVDVNTILPASRSFSSSEQPPIFEALYNEAKRLLLADSPKVLND